MAQSPAPKQEPSNKTQRRAVDSGIDLSRLPRHIAMIMDGNGRWAKGRGMMRLVGHREGYRTLKDVLLSASRLGIRYLTVYAFSAENWRRPKAEVGGLMRLIEEAAVNELQGLIEDDVRVLVAGRTEDVPTSLQEALQGLVERTKSNGGITFTLAINYGGRAEIVDALKQLLEDGAVAEELTEDSISSRMYCPECPDPDLIIRTAGEMRLSNFMIWQAAYAELCVTDVEWPEFGEEELMRCVLEFQGRDRKFGGLSE